MAIVSKSKGLTPPDYIKELQTAVGKTGFNIELEMTNDGSIVTLKWNDATLTATQKAAALAYATTKGLA